MDSRYLIALLLIALVLPGRAAASGQAAADTAAGGPTEEDYYRLITVPIPEGVVLEVGGLATLPGGRLAVSTRRGDVWVLDNAYAETPDRPVFTRFAQGLHESLGLAYHDGALLAA
ncbi:MAG: auracyanin family protein, partial [Longimicrobiales bacterium]